MPENLKAEIRPVPTPALNAAKKKGKVPAELYGNKQQNQHLFLNQIEFEKIYRAAGESSLIDLNLDADKPFKVLIQQVDVDPMSGHIIHADLLQVRMDEALQVNIPLMFIGESKAVKELGGTLVKSLEEVEVSCLPGDLISHLDVDISSLNTFEDAIRVADLNFPKNIKVITEPETTVALVQAQKVEVVEEKPVEVAAIPTEAEAKAAENKNNEETKE